MTKTHYIKENTELKKGFIKTELGWMPREWEKIEFGDFVTRNSAKHNPKDSDINFPCIELEHIEQGTGKILGWANSTEQASIKNRFNKNSILFGKLRPYLKKYWKSDIVGVCSSEIWVLEGKKNICSNDYLFYLVQQHKFIEVCNRTSGSKMPRADWGLVSLEPFVVPPLPEQQKIAAILSTWDKAIDKLTQLIAAKEQQKKGLMQQLLSGEVRLCDENGKRFEGEWKEVKLGEVISIGSSKRVLQDFWMGEGVPFIRTREVISLGNGENFRTPIFISEDLFSELKEKYGVPEPGDLLVTGVGTIGETYIVQQSDRFYFKDGNVLWFKMNHNVDSMFLHQQFRTKFIKKQLSDNASITTVSTFTIEGAKETRVLLPILPEQQKIASVLSAADREIELLKKELKTLEQQKKGLMQVLLTGEVRVKTNKI